MPLSRPSADASSAQRWFAKFAHLNAEGDRGQGVAPHKPLLLFCVLDMFEAGSFADGRVEMSAELVFRFETYWSFVVERRRAKPDIRLPFHALGSVRDRVWQCLTEDGRPSPARGVTRICSLEPTLLAWLREPSFREKARRILLGGRYFQPLERVALAAAMDLPAADAAELARLQEDAAAYRASERKGRDGRFKVEVVTRYGFTCALTGYRLRTETGNMVEAAHIHQRADSLDDDPRNGLALTPNAHWLFDAGLWTVSERQEILIASDRAYHEWSLPGGVPLRSYGGRELFFKDGCSFRPGWHYFDWHRRNRFVG